MTTTPPGTRLGTCQANGLTFHYLEAGEGPLALLLHGFPDAAPTWRHLLGPLAAAGYRAVAPWLRGYAPTEVPTDGLYQPGAIATDVAALHETLSGDAEAVLIGHDWGAIAAYTAAGSRPEQWRRLVTLAVPPLGNLMEGFLTYDQLHRSWYMFFFQHPLAEAAVALEDLAFIDRLWADWSPGYDASADLPGVKDALRDPANLAAALGYYRAMLGDGLKDPALAGVEAAGYSPMPVPTLYLHGADDGCMGADLVPDLAGAGHAPGSTSAVLDGCGHFLHLERPDEVNRRILAFLAS